VTLTLLGESFMSANTDHYWADNIRLILKLLFIWFLVSFVFGIMLVEQLNSIEFAGFKLGFWFSQQGSIISFVFLIFYYIKKMSALDAKYGVDD
jgi:putative solute:sodium symporter small subunit